MTDNQDDSTAPTRDPAATGDATEHWHQAVSHLVRGHLTQTGELANPAPNLDGWACLHQRTHLDHLRDIPEFQVFWHARDERRPQRLGPAAGALRPFRTVARPAAEADREAGA